MRLEGAFHFKILFQLFKTLVTVVHLGHGGLAAKLELALLLMDVAASTGQAYTQKKIDLKKTTLNDRLLN